MSPHNPETKELADALTTVMVRMPGMCLDQIVYTVQFAQVAQMMTTGYAKKHDFLGQRYGDNPNQLKLDLDAQPLVLRRLERLAAELPQGTTTQLLAQKYIPFIKRFGDILIEYDLHIHSEL